MRQIIISAKNSCSAPLSISLVLWLQFQTRFQQYRFFSDFNIMVIICGYHWEKFVCTGKYIKPINYKFQKTTDVLCKKIFPEKTQQPYLLTPNREPTTDKSTDTTKAKLSEPMEFYWDYLQEYVWEVTGAEMTQEIHTAEALPNTGDIPQELGTWVTLHSLQAIQQIGQCPL